MIDDRLKHLGHLTVTDSQAVEVYDRELGEMDVVDRYFSWNQDWYIHRESYELHFFDGWGIVSAYQSDFPNELRESLNKVLSEIEFLTAELIAWLGTKNMAAEAFIQLHVERKMKLIEEYRTAEYLSKRQSRNIPPKKIKVMEHKLDTDRLAVLVRTERAGRGLRELADEIGEVSPSTLGRIEDGKIPDMMVFLRVCNWLQIPPAELFIDESKLSIKEAEGIADASTQTQEPMTNEEKLKHIEAGKPFVITRGFEQRMYRYNDTLAVIERYIISDPQEWCFECRVIYLDPTYLLVTASAMWHSTSLKVPFESIEIRVHE